MSLLETVAVQCPFCWETIDLFVDLSAGDQHYTEDCTVCCRPLSVQVRIVGGHAELDVEAES